MVEKEEKENETETSGLMIYDEGFVPEWKIRREAANTDEATGEKDSASSDQEKAVAQSEEALPVAVSKTTERTEYNDAKIEVMIQERILKDVLNTIRVLGISEVRINADKDGMGVRQITPDHVALVSLSIPRESLIMYHYNTMAESIEFALDVDELYKLISSYPKNDTLTLSVPIFNQEAQGKLIVQSYNGTTAEMDLIEKDAISIPRIPDIKVEDYAVMPTKKFRDTMKTIKHFSDVAHIKFDTETVKISTHTYGDSNINTETVFTRDDIKEMLVREPGWVEYPVDYLSQMANGIKSTEFRMTLKKDYPVRIDFELIAEAGGDNIKVTYLLAPRINN
ncbi:hypothetical protein [Thermoplasma sp. Kam2015]|uniref:hypothetical protein n=1 Tax=Thermoplasma sp. Kam2015 TaxID=2094122 RepID=UPI001293812C|nr:hypothetical protein [Thermoplasma sp. Kam2015]